MRTVLLLPVGLVVGLSALAHGAKTVVKAKGRVRRAAIADARQYLREFDARLQAMTPPEHITRFTETVAEQARHMLKEPIRKVISDEGKLTLFFGDVASDRSLSVSEHHIAVSPAGQNLDRSSATIGHDGVINIEHQDVTAVARKTTAPFELDGGQVAPTGSWIANQRSPNEELDFITTADEKRTIKLKRWEASRILTAEVARAK
jgi:hypothetical protein